MRSSVTRISAALFTLVISFSIDADPVLTPSAIIDPSTNDRYPAEGYAGMNRQIFQLQNLTVSVPCQNCPEDIFSFASYRQQSLIGNLPGANSDALPQPQSMNLTTIAVTPPRGDFSALLIIPSTVALFAIVCAAIMAYRPRKRHRHRV